MSTNAQFSIRRRAHLVEPFVFLRIKIEDSPFSDPATLKRTLPVDEKANDHENQHAARVFKSEFESNTERSGSVADEVVGAPAPSQVAAPPMADAVAQSLDPAATLDSASAPALPPPLDLPIPLVFTTVQELQSRRRMGRVNKKYYLSRGVSISRGKFSAQIILKEGRRTVNLGSAFDFLEMAETAVKLADHFVQYMEKTQRGIESAALKAYVKDELLKFMTK
jgi:hypothetical protein